MTLAFHDLTPQVYAALRRESGMPVIDEAMVAQALGASYLTVRCLDGATTCGMLRIVGDGALVLVLCDVLVLPPYRRRGIGTFMIQSALKRVETLTMQGKWVSILLTCAGDKQGYYQRFGFHTLEGGLQGVAMQAFVKGQST